jgi:hypothetical protein
MNVRCVTGTGILTDCETETRCLLIQALLWYIPSYMS